MKIAIINCVLIKGVGVKNEYNPKQQGGGVTNSNSQFFRIEIDGRTSFFRDSPFLRTSR